MSKLKDLDELFPIDLEENGNHGDSKHCNINRNGYFYHVTQQCWNHRNYYSFDSARYRDSLVKSTCRSHNVLLLMNVIMPNHVHEVFYSKDFSNIQAVQQAIGSKVSRFITTERIKIFEKETPRVFQSRPTYTVIESRFHLFYLMYYLFHNGDYLHENGKQIPFSCFETWRQANFKEYHVDIFEKLFDLNINRIMNYCEIMSKEDYQALNKKLFGRYISSDIKYFLKN